MEISHNKCASHEYFFVKGWFCPSLNKLSVNVLEIVDSLVINSANFGGVTPVPSATVKQCAGLDIFASSTKMMEVVLSNLSSPSKIRIGVSIPALCCRYYQFVAMIRLHRVVHDSKAMHNFGVKFREIKSTGSSLLGPSAKLRFYSSYTWSVKIVSCKPSRQRTRRRAGPKIVEHSYWAIS